MDNVQSSGDGGIFSAQERSIPSAQKTISSENSTDRGEKRPPSSTWQEFLSESAIAIDEIEEGPLNEPGNGLKNVHKKLELNVMTRRPVWKEFASDPGVNVSDMSVAEGKLPRHHSLDDLQTKTHRDWNQFLSTSHLLDEGTNSKGTTSLEKPTEAQGTSSADVEDVTTRQWVSLDAVSKSSTTNSHDPQANQTLSEPSDFIPGTNITGERTASANLPIRPLTIGDNETIGNSLVYRPLSPFDPDLYPSRTASSTPITPPVPTTSQHSENIIGVETNDRGDMSARERLQPLGRDGLEVKQGPPWGMSIPLFQPHSRNSSLSSNDSNSSNNGTNFVRLQAIPQSPKADAEPTAPAVTIPYSEGQISRRSSLRSLESKEPMAVKMMSAGGTLKTRIGRFHELRPTNGETESPVSKILGPTFKTTQKILDELKRRPLVGYDDNVDKSPAVDDTLKGATKDQKTLGSNDEKDALIESDHFLADLPGGQSYGDTGKLNHASEERLSHGSVGRPNHERVERLLDNHQIDDDHQSANFLDTRASQEDKDDLANVGYPSWPRSANSMQSRERNFLVENNRDVDHFSPASWSQVGESRRLVEDYTDRGLYGKNESHKTSGVTDSTLATSMAIPAKVDSIGSTDAIIADTHIGDKPKEAQNISGTAQESLSWEDILNVESPSSGKDGELNEFDRVASQSISLSNALAASFREELKSSDLLDVESDDEGTLTDDANALEPMPDSAVSESTTNDEIFRPKGLHPLTQENGPVGIYDVRNSCGPGSTNRRRFALGQQPRVVNRPAVHSVVYVSEGTTEYSGNEVEDKAIESQPEGQSTPKSRNDAAAITSEYSESKYGSSYTVGDFIMTGATVPSKSASMARTQSSAAVDSTWSVRTPVMSQLNTQTMTRVSYESRPKKKYRPRREQEAVLLTEYDRKAGKGASRQRDQSKKTSKTIQQRSINSSENLSSEYSNQKKSPIVQNKKSVADIILENFRRDEQEQKKRERKMEELKQIQTTDLNALWERFQVVLGKNSSKSSKASFSHSSLRTTPSTLSSASNSDIPSTENKKRDHSVDLTTDSDEEFQKFLSKVREIHSSSSESVTSRVSSEPRRKHVEARSAPTGHVLRKSRSRVSAEDSSDQITTTTEKKSEPETPLLIPMWLGMKTKPSKRRGKAAVETGSSTVCTCGARARKSNSKSTTVRDVGVNCPTPSLLNGEINVVNIAAPEPDPLEESGSNNAPLSLVKLSLQDAFVYSNQDFIERSCKRVENIKEKRKQKRTGVVVVPTERTRRMKEKEENVITTVTPKPLKIYDQLVQKKPRQMTQIEIRDVNKRMYKNLPEVKKRKEEQRRADFYKTNRLRAQLYGKHVRNLNRMYTAP